MVNLCTVQDLSALIQVTVAVDDAPALAAIAAASAAIRGYCRQVLSLVTDDHVVLSPACGRVLLPELPVVAVSAVSLAGTVLAAGRTASRRRRASCCGSTRWPRRRPGRSGGTAGFATSR
jgi:hypothetical protein